MLRLFWLSVLIWTMVIIATAVIDPDAFVKLVFVLGCGSTIHLLVIYSSLMGKK